MPKRANAQLCGTESSEADRGVNCRTSYPTDGKVHGELETEPHEHDFRAAKAESCAVYRVPRGMDMGPSQEAVQMCRSFQ